MKKFYVKKGVLSLIFLAILIIVSCSNDSGGGGKEESGVIEFTTKGSHIFKIDADNIIARITIIGAGGGGAGGATDNTNLSRPGGGGGGAGKKNVFNEVFLISGASYEAVIGDGGVNGNIDSNGGIGDSSILRFDLNTIVSSPGGKGGLINPLSDEGGPGGPGFPNGLQGQGVQNNGAGGKGGSGGDNGSEFGNGGAGGNGSGNNVDATNGSKGTNGYIKIEWVGTKLK